MRKIYKPITLLFFLFLGCSLLAQPTVDGDLSDGDYTSLGTKENANASFGTAIDVIEILYYPDNANNQLYLGVKGKLNTGSNDGIGVFVNFTETTGIAAGNNLGFSGAGHYMDGQGGGTNDDFKADFEVDYMFAMNPGGGTTSVFLDAAEVVGATGTDFIGTANQSGGTATDNDVFGTGASATYAFNNGGGADQGFEIVIDYAALGITDASEIEVMAFVVSESGFFSDVTVPGNVTSGNMGFNADFSTEPGGAYHTSLAPLPVELSYFEAIPNQNTQSVAVEWITISEKDNAFFALERSVNGLEFDKIATIEGIGNSFERQEYSYLDETPNKGINYYRLRQVDEDGTSNYSQVLSVELQSTEISVFPNPVGAELSVRLSEMISGGISFFNAQGQLVDYRRIVEEQSFEVSMEKLTPGIYFYNITNSNGEVLTMDRLIKN